MAPVTPVDTVTPVGPLGPVGPVGPVGPAVGSSHPASDAPTASTSEPMPLVLLIEDNSDNARLVQRVLANSRFRLMHARDGESGQRMAVEYRPQLILLDLGLPDIEGQKVALFIRQAPELRTVKLVAVTAWPEETGREMVRAYGCDGYIPKPIDVRRFIEQLEELLRT